MTFKSRLETFHKTYLTSMFLSKLTLIILNTFFITLDLVVATYLWITIYRLESIRVDLPEAEIESIVSTKKCGIILASGIVITISMLGIVGAARANSNMLITYDVIGLLTILVLLLGWRNYQTIFWIYIAVVCSVLTALLVALFYIRAIKNEPYRIRRQLLLVNGIYGNFQ